MRGRRRDVVTFEGLIDEQRTHIEQVVRDLGRRNYLTALQTDQFRATVLRSLQGNDFELLRAFDGRSTWETYLITVISREFFLFQGCLWGQWRPSRSAQQLGAAAVLLEKLVRCDGHGVSDAIQMMRTLHRVPEPRHRLLRMSQRLRLADSSVEASGAKQRQPAFDERHEAALRQALTRLSPDDRLIIELRVRDLQPLTRIALMMGLEVTRLSDVLEHAKECIGESLLEQGIARDQVNGLLQHVEADPAHPQHKCWCAALSSPSQ
jgi:hypothetical protein